MLSNTVIKQSLLSVRVHGTNLCGYLHKKSSKKKIKQQKKKKKVMKQRTIIKENKERKSL